LSFKDGDRRGYLDGFAHGAGFKGKIDDHVLANVDHDVSLGDRLNPLDGGGDLVAADPDGAEFVGAVRARGGRQTGVGALIS